MTIRPNTRFASEDAGNVGIIFGLCMIPVMACMGVAVDYARAVGLRDHARSIADGVALTIAASDAPNAIADKALASAKASLQSKYGTDVSALGVTGKWLDNANYNVTISGDLKAFILPAVPGMPKEIGVVSESVVRAIPPIYGPRPPTTTASTCTATTRRERTMPTRAGAW